MNQQNHSKNMRTVLAAVILGAAIFGSLVNVEPAHAQDKKIGYGQSGYGVISNAYSVEWWEFSGTAGDVVTIRQHCSSGNLAPALKLWLHNGKDWEVLTWSTSGSCGIDAVLNKYTLPKTGTYVIGASRYQGEDGTTAGDYTLSLALNSAGHAGTASTNTVDGCAGDSDCDGMPDTTETFLIENFKPVLTFDEDEAEDCVNPVSETATLYQVTPYAPGRYDPEGALITVVILYPYDCGGLALDLPGTFSHPGDTEALRLYVTNDALTTSNGNFSTGWRVNKILMKRHYDDWGVYEASEFAYAPDAQTGLETHPVIWVSWSKHAMFPSFDACEDYGALNLEYCGGGPMVTLYTPASHNVGERSQAKKFFDLLSDAGSPVLTRLFSDEYAWTDLKFCGNWVVADRDDCGGSLFGKWWPSPQAKDRNLQEKLLQQ